ncbi:filamentous hemagglutinin N-terminal domain-containing protein [Polynucleobacter paneuropaeus]|nr:filamentous hemagglutinin N-terminal domain-containing protein [Polynucleobacter paneuropaeus]
MERSLLSSNHPEKQFDVKLPMAGKVFALVCLFALSTQFAVAQNKIAVNALPTGGKVVAGAATISSTSTATSATMNINQTSQRAVINWQTFNVGKNATVNFNQPNSSAVTLNRVVSATPSMIQGAINANGQVILVNPNGVTFGKGAEVNAAGVVASTLNISNQDFMNGKNIYSGNGEGKIVNKGTITATDPNGYIALLAPEIRNQGYLIARMGPSSTVALASGEKISLDFRGTQLIGVSIDKAAYKALIENKRIIETNGGLIIVAAGTARELMSSVIQNTGRISANSIVDNGGVIELVADNVTNSGSISANGSTNGVGGQVNIVGNNITLAANSKTTATGNLGGGSIQVGVGKTVATNTTPASAVNGNANTAAAPQTAAQILASNTQGVGTQAQTVSVEQGAVVDASAINSGNGGAIVIWSQVKTTVNGILKAVGGYLNGNGGLIETSSAGLVSLGKSLSIDTSSGKGSAGLWYVDPIDLTIDGASSAVISAALVNNNVSITVAGNTCPSLGSCTQNGSGNLTIASGADIIKQSGSLTTLTLTASGVFNLNANISGQNLDVIINSSIAYLNAGSTITANQVTVQAQTIYSYGNINSGSLSNLGSAIQLLGSALYISGNLTVGANLANSSNSTNSNSNTVSYNGTLIRQEDLPTYLAAANQTTLNLDQVYATTAANQASFTTAVNNQITLTGTESISIAATAQLLANGTTGGVIMATAPQINLVTSSNSSPSSGSQSIQGNGSLIQANGNNGPGGTISFTAANDFNINFATISASGSTDGGSIRLISSGGNLLMANSLIQTNGGTGRGGSLGVSGANSTTINSSTLEATGFSKGGSIMVGYDSAGKTLPYSESTTIDAATILNANQTDSTNTTGGGLIETSGGTLTQLASINAGRGGMWLLDPYDYVINTVEAMSISNLLNGGTNVSISTLSPSINLNGQVVNGLTGAGVIYIYSAITATQNTATLTFTATTIYLGANITTRGAQTYNGNVVVLGEIQLYTIGSSGYNGDYTPDSTNLTITGTVSGGYAANALISLTGNGGYFNQSTGYVGVLSAGGSTSLAGGILAYVGQDGSGLESQYTWTPTYTSIGTALVVGAGGGGGAYGGAGGSGGGVVGQNLLPQLAAGTAYTIYVGNGGTGGNFVTTNGAAGGYSSISGGQLGSMLASGGSGGVAGSTNGGSGAAGNASANNGGNGVQVSVVNSTVSGSQGQFVSTSLYFGGGASSFNGTTYYYGGGGGGAGGASTDTAPTYYGYGGIASTRRDGLNYTPQGCIACDRNGNPGQPNTGMGGGGGVYSGSYIGLGGNGANGVVMIHAVSNPVSSLSIEVFQNSVSLTGVSGSGIGTSNLSGLNINAGPLGTNKSAIQGVIQGQLNLSFTSDATWGTPGAAASALVLSGANTFTGSTTINNGGTLVVANHATLGDPNNNLTLNGTGILDLQYSVSVGNFVMGGTNSITNSAGNSAFQVLGTATLGGSIITSGTQNYYGPVTLIADTTLSTNNRNASGAAINFNGAVDSSSTNVLPKALTTTTVNSFTTFSGAVGALNPIGNLTVNGSSVISANINTQGTQTYKGNVIIGGAKVFLDSTQLDQNFGQAISINGNLDGAGGGATNNLSILSGQAAMTITGNIGSSNPLASLSLGQINTNGYTYAGQPGGINISGSVNAGATLIINSSYYDNRITGVISGATSVVASGGGGLTLSAVNTYTGSTTIKGDTFFLTADSNLGAAPSTPVIGDLVLDGGYLTVNTSSSFALSPNRWVSIIGSGTIQPGQGATLTIGGNIAGPGVLTKGGYGTLVLGGNNYQLNGNIFVTFGTLQAASAAAFGASGNTVSSAANTTIDLAGASQTASYIFNLNGGVLTNSNGSISAALASGSVIKTSDSVSILSFSGPGILDLSNTVLDDGNRGAAFGGGANVIATNPQNSVAYIASDMANSINLTSSTNLTTSSLVGYSGITRAGTVTLTSSGYITVNTPISSYGNVSLTSNLSSGGSNALTVNAGITSANQNISLNAPYGSISISSALSAGNGSVSIVGGFSNSFSQGNTAIYDTSYITALTISATGTGDPAYVTLGNLNATGSMGNGITVSSKGNITVGSITNTGSAGIKIMAGSGMAAGDISSGGSITSLGPINNSGGAVALSTAAPSVNAGSAGTIEAAIGISPSTASIATNISYGIAGGTLVHPGAYLGNYIDYRQTASVAYSVTLASNYSAVYGTAYNSSSANAWLLANASVGLTGTGFGYSTSAAGANLRFSSRVNGVADSNVVQTASTITSSSLYSTDGSVITLSGPSRTYTITPAPLGISVNGVYSGTNVITPTSFTTYGLVNGDTIGGLSTATLAFKDVNSVNNYVTAISIGTGSAILSNYQLNPLGRNIATNSALMNSVTLTPIALTVSGAVAANKTYDGTTVATLSASGLNGVLAQDTANVALTLSSGSFANKNVGTNITVTAAGSISGSAVAAGDYTLIQPTVTANISPAPLGVSISGTYTGSTLINNPNIGIAGLVNNETLTSISQAVMSSPNVSANGSNYVVSFTIGAGTASLSNYVINSGYYATPGYTNNMVTLTPKTLTTSGSSAYSKTYDGTNIASINPGTLVGVINSDNVSIFSNAGTFASSNAANNVVVTPNLVLGGTASSNYSLTQPTGLTANISKAPLGISIAATYNGSTTVTPTILGVNGLVNGETLSSITSAVISNANVANTLTTYATSITIGSGTASMSNYMLGSTRNNSTSSNSENIVTITPKALSLSAVKVYDGTTTLSGSQITMTGLIGTQTLNYTGANINDANVATPNKYISSITLTDGANGGLASNYLAPTLTSAYTYNNATVNQKAVALSATKVYDANNTLTGGQVTINTGVSGETLTYSGATVNDINVATAGKYINAITLGNAVSGNGVASNYLLPTLNSTNAPVTITKASLTVTANAAAMTYGASVLPSFSATITGFVGSDTSSAVTGTASFSTNATPYNGQAGSGSSVGTYSITPALGSLASGNYSFGVFSQGSLVVNKGNLTITASNDSKVYGASSTTAGVNYTAGGTAINSTVGYTTSGLVNGDTITAVTLTSTGGAVPTNVGTYTITPSALVGGTNVTNSNYTISYINASTGLAVNPKVVTLAATKTYDATNALNTVVISGLIGSQTLTYSGATTNDVNVATTGKYLNAITLGNATDGSGGLAANYALPSLTVASANNAVTITAKVVGLSASKTYDATTTLTGAQVVITTGVGSQTLSYTGATANDANVATANKYISAITLANATDSSGGLASNYALPTLNNANAAVVISPKVVGLSAAKIYDATTALTGNQVTITTGINGQSLSYTGATANDSNVVTAGKVISAITLVNGTGGIASNYALPTLDAINAPVTITPKTVTLSAIKTYDSTTTLFAGQVTINTGIAGQTLTYSAGTINNANVSANGSNFITALTLNSLTGTASNYALPTLNSTNAPVTVNPATLTVTGSVSPDKTYDGTTVTTVSNGQLQGLINNQTLTLSQAGAFASANAGTAINVVVNDSIANGTGTNAGIASNYSLTQPTDVVANITPKNLTVTGSATSNKVYDGTFTATITGGQLVGVVAADIANVVLTQTGTFTAANVGNAIAITANDSLSGTQAGNYSLTQPTVAAANITPKTLSLSATKTYDSTTSLLGAVTILTGVGTETLGYTAATASDANVVTTGKYITAITLVNGSGLASNYVLPVLNVANAPVTINPVTALVVVGATAQGKTYDGTTSVTLSNTGTLQGLIGSQTLTLTEAGAFATANAGSAVNVVMNDRIADGTNGGLASNYSLTQPTYVMAPIAKAPLGVTVSGTYTASTTIAPSTFTTNGLVNNETITALSSATVNDANVMTANNYVKSIVIGAGTANVNNYVIGPNYNNLAGNTQNIATITPKVITVSGTQVANKEYNATTTANLTGGTLVGVINSDSANVNLVQAGNFASANIGNPVAVTASDTITGSAASNYSLTQPTGLSAIITSKALTITIAAETKIYGDGIAKTSNSVDGTNTSSQSVNYTNGVATNSFQGFSVSGLVTGSNDAVNTVTLTSAGGALTAGVASGAAAYAITGSGAVGVNLGNYAINYVSNNYSVMTVTPRPLNVTVANASMAYGATALPNFTSTITGLVNGDQASAVLSTTATPYNGQAGSASNIGSYAITAAAVSNANYSVISTNGTLTVNPVTLVLQANTQGGTGSPIVYGTPTVLNQNASVALTAASLAGLTNGDHINTVSVTFNGSQTISGATAAGTYTGALVASGASGTGLSNYSISYQPGNLIISKAVLTVTAANDARFTSQTEATGTYNGVVFSGFKNADTVSNLDMSGLLINRVNATTPNAPVSNNVGNYAGSLAPSGIATSSCNTCLPNGNAQNGSPSLNGNYTFNYVNGNYSILGAGQILVKYAPVTMSYGSVTNTNINYGTPVVSYMAAGSNLVSSSDGLGTVTVNPTIANLQNSTAGYLNTGSYSLNPTATVTSSTTNLSNLAVTIVGGITVMPKVLSFANLGISGVSKVYDGLTTMTGLSLNVGTGVFLAQGPTTDNVTVVANGAFTDKNVGTAKSYTVGVSFGGADANNYVISGGGVYTADGITNPANGTITQLSSVTYIGAATGGAWSDPNSWQVTNGTTKGAIPDASMVNGVATNNVANIIVPVGNTVVYDAGVSNAAPITSNLANAGNVSFGSALASNATFNVAMTISGAGSVTIAGPGTLTLSGANTYTGNTIISNGSTLSVTAANSIGAGNIQGSGGSLRVANGISLAQINATGTLRLLSDVVTSGNQAWGNLTVTQSPLTTLTSTNGNITFNGLLDGASSKANSLLVLAPNGNVTFNNSVGSVMPLNVLEVDASRININADVLTSDQQNYCGMAGCYSQLSSAQVSANYCATTGNNCYSKNTSTLAFNLLASGMGTTGDYVLNTDIQVNPAPTAQVYIGDNGAVGFLYNTYGTYATKAFGSTPPLFQNNAVFARTLISKDPMVTFGGAINDASAASTHTLQAAAIKVSNASSPNIQFGGSIGNTNPLYSINALTQFIDAANSMNGSIKFAANTTITSISNMSYGSNSFTPTGVTFQTVSPSASINFVVPAGSPFSLAGGQIKSNYVNYNGAATRTLGGITAQVSLSGGIVTPRAAAPVSAPSTRNSFILAAVAEQTKIERKYDVDASVDVGEIETDTGPTAKDEEEQKKKKAGNQKAAQ